MSELCPRLNPFPNKPWFLRVCNTSIFENTEGKGEIAHNEQFLLFPQCFLPVRRTFCHFHQVQNCRLQTLSVWKSLKFVVWERVKTKWQESYPNGQYELSLSKCILRKNKHMFISYLTKKKNIQVLVTRGPIHLTSSWCTNSWPFTTQSRLLTTLLKRVWIVYLYMYIQFPKICINLRC